MSDMLKRYEESKKPRIEEAKKIPDLAVDFVDQQDEFQKGWTNGQKSGDPTTFTKTALEYYDTEVKQITLPAGFQPIEQGVPLNRYGPAKKYYNAGQP